MLVRAEDASACNKGTSCKFSFANAHAVFTSYNVPKSGKAYWPLTSSTRSCKRESLDTFVPLLLLATRWRAVTMFMHSNSSLRISNKSNTALALGCATTSLLSPDRRPPLAGPAFPRPDSLPALRPRSPEAAEPRPPVGAEGTP